MNSAQSDEIVPFLDMLEPLKAPRAPRVFPSQDYNDLSLALPFETFQYFAECILAAMSVLKIKTQMTVTLQSEWLKLQREMQEIEERISKDMERLAKDLKIPERCLGNEMKKGVVVDFLTWKFEKVRRLFMRGKVEAYTDWDDEILYQRGFVIWPELPIEMFRDS